MLGISPMKEQIEKIEKSVESFLIEGKDKLEQFRLQFLSKKGEVSQLFDEFKKLPGDQKREFGQVINKLKGKAEAKFKEFQEKLENDPSGGNTEQDLTLPGDPAELGSRHPINLVRNQILEIFSKIGFTVSEGPEIEDDWHNFSALNFPENHPARDMQDTFFIDNEISLRTHTSSVQVRAMEKNQPPLRIMSPGRVYRNEAISARAHCFFHQVEGLYIDERVSFSDLKQTLYYFVKEMFHENIEVRFRPSYFPFTEISAEMDISCLICGGDGCAVCKHTGWVEILGCGMVDPNVLKNCDIDPEKYTGFAFGMGVERITMLKYDVNDLRTYSRNDVRFLRQFTAEG